MLTSSCFPLEKVSGQMLDIGYCLSLGWLSQKWQHQSTTTIWNPLSSGYYGETAHPEVAVPRLCKAGHSGGTHREPQPWCQVITQARAKQLTQRAESTTKAINAWQSLTLPDRCVLLQPVALLHSLPISQQLAAAPNPTAPGAPDTLPVIQKHGLPQ